MDIYRLKDLSQDERQTVLLGEAVKVEEQSYLKPLTPDELHVRREEMANDSILLNEYEAELKEIKDAFKLKMNPVEKRRDEALEAIRLKSISITGKVFMLADHDNKMIHSVTEDGSVLGSRPMLPEERQYRINTLNKAM